MSLSCLGNDLQEWCKWPQGFKDNPSKELEFDPEKEPNRPPKLIMFIIHLLVVAYVKQAFSISSLEFAVL